MAFTLDSVKALAMPVLSIFGTVSESELSMERARFWESLDGVPSASSKFSKLLEENHYWRLITERHNCTLAGHPKIFFDIERRYLPTKAQEVRESELNLFVLDNRYPVLQIVEYLPLSRESDR